MFNNFKNKKKKVNGVNINYKIGGTGHPILLLHGYPQTHMMWRKVAPLLAKDYTVVSSDLRGYGDSDKPQSDKRHKPYSKREMAKDQSQLMKALGFKSYNLVGHDRGARVAHRMALDYSTEIKKVILLDIVPTLHVFENTDQELAKSYYHWFFLIQPFPFPETLISNNPEYYLKSKLRMWGPQKQFIDNKTMVEYVRCFSKKETIHATCEDYRAGATIDLEDHKKDKAKRIVSPLLILWGKKATVERLYKPVEVWKEWAINVTGHSLDCGHFIPEEKPNATYKSIIKFLHD